MNSKLNRGNWKQMENKWAKSLKNGKEVEVNIDIEYKNNNKRPIGFIVKYLINGKKNMQAFKN